MLKPKTYRSKKYRKFVESLPCAVEHQHKKLDEWKGDEAFEKAYGVSIETIRRETLEAYIRRGMK